jgi:UPF0755 protein
MDIKPPPRRPIPPPVDPVLPSPVETREIAPEPADMKTVLANRHKAKQRRLWLIVGGLLLALLASFASWYAWALSPRDSNDSRQIRFVVESGEGSASIASELESHDLIRSAVAFQIYAELTGTKAKLQAGGFALSPSMSVKEVVDHIVKGNTDDLTVLILPGLTLDEQADPEVKNSLAAQGFDSDEIQSAFETVYDHPLFEGRPAGEGIEGFIFPETYRIRASDPLSVVIKKSFDEVYGRLQEDGMIAKFQAQGLNLYQAFTLASIVQKEVSNPDDQKQVAQVFLKRLKESMVLGSDVTFFYAAKQMGVEPSVNLDSPYNTRRYGGLPPGPISNMNYSALQAVAEPAPGDYLYFVAGDGDDAGKTFFARTEAEHQANIAAHCHTLCN